MRVVSLEVPPRVRRGDKVQLDCLYDLEGNSLYSLKWFFRSTESENEKEEQEFFRFTPRESDKKQYFPLPGLKVDVNTIFVIIISKVAI